MTVRSWITLLLALMVNAVVFGIGATMVLSIPSLNEWAAVLLPIVIVVSFLLGPIIAYKIAPMLRSRYQRKLAVEDGTARM